MRVKLSLPCRHHHFKPPVVQRMSVRSTSGVPMSQDWLSEANQLIQRSSLPTYHFQKSLFRLPVPPLNHSCDRYLEAVSAVFGEYSDEYVHTKELVVNFLDGEGMALQKELTQHANQNKHTSYISEPWFDTYLSSRVPCPINFNPFMMFAPDSDSSYNDQLLRATNLVISFGRFKKALDAELLKPEVFHMNPSKSDTKTFEMLCRASPSSIRWLVAALAFKAYPLDMSQYQSLFGGCRIPQRGKDRLHHNRNAKHFIVAHRGHFYNVKLFDQNGMLVEPKQIYASFSHICNGEKLSSTKNSQTQVDECVGSLTTLDRDTWADIRCELIGTNSKNHDSLTAIEDALFLLCLDDLHTSDPERLMQSLLCGDDGSNRWFDKCFQLIVDGNGQATINFEHSWGDGVAVLRLMEETLKDTINNRFIHIGQKGNFELSAYDTNVQKIEWHLNNSLREKIRNAQELHLKQCQKLDFGVVQSTTMSKEDIKRAKLSPDAMMQLAFQIAFHSVYHEFVPTYESCSTAAFLKGRTECIRSATQATRKAVEAFEGSCHQNNKNEMRTLLNGCSEKHYQLVKEASMGKGFDRHFFGLRLTAERLGYKTPRLFTHPVYERMNHFVLSTSTLSTDTIYFGGFGPVVPDGIGIGYSVTDTKLGAVAIAYNDKRSAKEFAKALDISLDKIRRIIADE